MPEIFTFGKYKGKSVEQVAAVDFMYLDWILNNGIKEQSLKSRVEKVIHTLNNFKPKVRCAQCYYNPAEFISIVYSNYFGVHNLSVSIKFVYCGNEDCVPELALSGEARLYPIKFSILSNFPASPKYIRRNINKVLFECTGFRGKKTKKALEELINNLASEIN